jgi:hypothetical protein
MHSKETQTMDAKSKENFKILENKFEAAVKTLESKKKKINDL